LTHYWDPDFAQNAADADASLQAADRAVALAPASPYAHTVRGEALLKKVDFIHADAEQTLAHRLGPEDALATRGYALMQCMLGHRAEAEAASRHMLELDPLRSRLYHDRAYVQTVDRDYDGALVTIAHERALGVDDQPFIRAYTAWVHLAQNKPEAAAADCRPGCAWPEFNNAVIAHKLGHFAEAQASLDKLHVIAAGKLFYDDAKIYAQWGDAPAALRGLAKAVQSDPYDVRWIRVDESLDPIRQYPAFKKAEDSLNLPP
jgi:tetratricopeptide (TPR) repeat protein